MNYIAYYRTSTRRQSLGLEAQRRAVEEFLSKDNTNVLLEEYSEQESGKNDQREELTKAIEACKRKGARLIIAKLDRLSRKVSFIFQLKDSNVDFIALDIPDFNTLTLGIFATLAQSERELISQRTKNALNELKKTKKLGNPNAEFTQAMRAKAYERKSAIAQSNTNSKRAICVIKELLNKTNNLSEIARFLNENGFVTAKGCKFGAEQVKRLINRIK